MGFIPEHNWGMDKSLRGIWESALPPSSWCELKRILSLLWASYSSLKYLSCLPYTIAVMIKWNNEVRGPRLACNTKWPFNKEFSFSPACSKDLEENSGSLTGSLWWFYFIPSVVPLTVLRKSGFVATQENEWIFLESRCDKVILHHFSAIIVLSQMCVSF